RDRPPPHTAVAENAARAEPPAPSLLIAGPSTAIPRQGDSVPPPLDDPALAKRAPADSSC
ncbi:MAG TPA: hypothetical protein VGM32_10940, partial [Rhodopila sp.]